MHSFAMRPEAQSGSVKLARLSETIQGHPAGDMAAITAASTIVNDVMLEAGNATEHLSEGAQQTLKDVMKMIKENMYGSMTEAHGDDKRALADRIAKLLACNADIAALQSSTGLLGKLQQEATEAQYELNRLNVIVEDKTVINNTKWSEFENHMDLIQTPPDCAALPARTMPTLDVFFDVSLYSIWFAREQPRYFKKRDAWLAAHAALKEAIEAYNIQKAKLDVHYCDWKRELEAACARFDECWSTHSNYYTNELIPRVTKSMHNRIEVYKAGETLIVQIEFLLALRDSSETGDVDGSIYSVDFPALPQKEVCDLSPLTSSIWNPPIDCGIPDAMQGRWHDPEGGFYKGSEIAIEAHNWHTVDAERHWKEWGEQTFSMAKHESGFDLAATDPSGWVHHHIASLTSDGKIRVTKNPGGYVWTLVRVPEYYAAESGGDCASTCANEGRRCKEDSLKKVNSDVDSYAEVKRIAADLGLKCTISIGGYGNNGDTPQWKPDGKCLFSNNGGSKTYSCTSRPGDRSARRLCYCEV